MDKFIVSARKYRPQMFDTVVGQSHITTTLKNAVSNSQLAHAYLFCGPRGVGKTTCARILAKTINCENLQPDGEACNECNSCKSFNSGSSFNIHELDAASNNSVDDIRSLVDQVRFAPQAGKYKVYIVDEVHMLSAAAFNAFLKTLEEPPSYAIFILATTEKHKILPTILSRCQIFDFKRITTNDTVAHLQGIADKEHIHADKASLQVIAQKSEGCMRDALSILDKIVSFSNGEVTYTETLEHLNILDHDYYFRILDCMLQQDLAGGMLLYDEINRKGFEGDVVLNGFAEFLRNILVCKDQRAGALLDVVEGMQHKYFATAATVSTSYLVSALNILGQAEINYKMARNKRLHVELTIIKLNFLQQALQVTSESGQVQKKRRVDSPVAIQVKPIVPLQIKAPAPGTQPGGGKLLIETNKPAPAATRPVPPPATVAAPVNRSVAAEPAVQPATPVTTAPVRQPASPQNGTTATATTTAASRKGGGNLLGMLQAKYGDEYLIEEVKEAEPLEATKLQECWNRYTQKLEAAGNKHSVASAFRMARLNIVNDLHFTVSLASVISQNFIEQERFFLNDCIQEAFNNRGIHFKTVVEATEEATAPEEERPLSMREKFEKITSAYPLILELKDKLKLVLE
jgi:DNA polymerase-3 subunit gamma/tau